MVSLPSPSLSRKREEALAIHPRGFFYRRTHAAVGFWFAAALSVWTCRLRGEAILQSLFVCLA